MGRTRKGRRVDGLLLLDKAAGVTSNRALQQVKRLLGAAKAGHTGSLDPLATGVLPLCFGEATKFAQFLLDANKGYRSTFVLGVGTDTGDADGQVVEEASAAHVTGEAIAAAMTELTGSIDQIPPMYSALKVAGQPLYKRARAGETVERAPRPVRIDAFNLLQVTRSDSERIELLVEVLCSKGTYIRSLAQDLGRALGVPAHVATLRRTEAGAFGLGDTITLDALHERAQSEGSQALDRYLLSPEVMIQHLPRVELTEAATFYMRKGQAVVVPNPSCSGMVRILGAGGLFLGVGEIQGDGKLVPKRLVAQ